MRHVGEAPRLLLAPEECHVGGWPVQRILRRGRSHQLDPVEVRHDTLPPGAQRARTHPVRPVGSRKRRPQLAPHLGRCHPRHAREVVAAHEAGLAPLPVLKAIVIPRRHTPEPLLVHVQQPRRCLEQLQEVGSKRHAVIHQQRVTALVLPKHGVQRPAPYRRRKRPVLRLVAAVSGRAGPLKVQRAAAYGRRQHASRAHRLRGQARHEPHVVAVLGEVHHKGGQAGRAGEASQGAGQGAAVVAAAAEEHQRRVRHGGVLLVAGAVLRSQQGRRLQRGEASGALGNLTGLFGAAVPPDGGALCPAVIGRQRRSGAVKRAHAAAIQLSTGCQVPCSRHPLSAR
mmetsp:Transcript_19914/g.51039  ORF Transcript_19914/g.51039 Transcript_19914/m.51039 type:complete len:341 (-) Transcript_19914:400-1422(-)